jgi:hypothetical protein
MAERIDFVERNDFMAVTGCVRAMCTAGRDMQVTGRLRRTPAADEGRALPGREACTLSSGSAASGCGCGLTTGNHHMRRIFCTFLAASAVLAVGAGQAAGQTIGFKLGAAFSNLSGTTAPASGITGFSGGGHMRFGMGGRLGLQLEVLSVTKGADVGGTVSDAYRFEFVEIPVLVHIPLTAGTSFAPYVFGGGAAGIEVRCRVTRNTAGAIEVERNCDDAGLDRSSPDLSLVGGGGLAFAMGPGAILIEGRYTAGMRDIFTGADAGVRHRAASIMAGYEVPLGRAW